MRKPNGGSLVQPHAPVLVIVSGSAASGKTTLAERLAHDLCLPLLSRDGFKECLMDVLGCPDRQRSRELGAASYAILYEALENLVNAGIGTVVDSNFRRGVSEPEFQRYLDRVNALQLHCYVSPEIARARFRARAAGGDRHPGHHEDDPETLADFEASLTSGAHAPLDLAVPLIEVETTDGYSPRYATIRGQIEAQLQSSGDGHTNPYHAPSR